MKYSTSNLGNMLLEFKSPINRDNGYTNEYLGTFTSTMELFTDDKGIPEMIEWTVETTEEDLIEHIGLMFDGRTLEDYDGVFELPKQAISLIRKAGYRVPKDFE